MRLQDIYVSKTNETPYSTIMTIMTRADLPITVRSYIRYTVTGNQFHPTPQSRRYFTGKNNTKIKLKGWQPSAPEREYTINFGKTIYYGYINIDKSGYIELTATHELFAAYTSNMTGYDGEPGWRNTNIRDIVGADVNGYVDGISGISERCVLKVDTTGNRKTVILPYDYYGLTAEEWRAMPDDLVEFLIELKEPKKYILPSQQILTPEVVQGAEFCNVTSSNSAIYYTEYPIAQGQLNGMFKRSIQNNKKQYFNITYLLNDTVFDADDVVSGSFSFSTNGADSNSIKFGNAISSEVQFQLIGSDKTQTLNLQNEFRIDLGFDTTQNDKEFADVVWATLGYFKSKDIVYDKTLNIYTITAYDRMTHFDIDAKDFITHLDANTTYDPKDMFELLCRYVGVEYEPLTYSPTRKVSASNFNEISTLRELLNKIAEVYCSYAKITGEGKVKIEENAFSTLYTAKLMYNSDCYQLSETSQRKNYENSIWNDIAKFKWNELRGTKWNELYDEDDNYYFHGVKVVLSNEQVITYPSNLSSEEIMRDCYEINNNPFYNGYIDPDYLSELPDVIRDTIYTKLITNFQLPYSTEVSADDYFIFVEIGDIIRKYLEDDETYYSMPVYNFSFTWNGSFVCNISSARSLNDNR